MPWGSHVPKEGVSPSCPKRVAARHVLPAAHGSINTHFPKAHHPTIVWRGGRGAQLSVCPSVSRDRVIVEPSICI